MSYILYSSIARAGGIDLLLNLESFSHGPNHPFVRRPSSRKNRLSRLRRRGGRALIGLGEALARWGRQWAEPLGAGSGEAGALKLVR
jgi:hypothetical protein